MEDELVIVSDWEFEWLASHPGSELDETGKLLIRSPDGDVIHREPTLGQKLLDVAVRKREAQIPADRQENDLRFKLAPLEQAANRRVQKEHPTSLSRQACKVATLPRLR
jgi:hypothetical protein